MLNFNYAAGAFVFLKKLIKYILSFLFQVNKIIIFEIDLTKQVEITGREGVVSFKLATRNDILSMNKKNYNYDEKGKRYSMERMSKGDRCVLAVIDNQIIGYVWIMKGKMEKTQYKHMPISQDRCYIYKGFVRTEYRGRRVLNGIDQFIFSLLRKENCLAVITTVSKNNTSSVKARDRIGFERIGFYYHIVLLGRVFAYLPHEYKSYLQQKIWKK